MTTTPAPTFAPGDVVLLPAGVTRADGLLNTYADANLRADETFTVLDTEDEDGEILLERDVLPDGDGWRQRTFYTMPDAAVLVRRADGTVPEAAEASEPAEEAAPRFTVGESSTGNPAVVDAENPDRVAPFIYPRTAARAAEQLNAGDRDADSLLWEPAKADVPEAATDEAVVDEDHSCAICGIEHTPRRAPEDATILAEWERELLATEATPAPRFTRLVVRGIAGIADTERPGMFAAVSIAGGPNEELIEYGIRRFTDGTLDPAILTWTPIDEDTDDVGTGLIVDDLDLDDEPPAPRFARAVNTTMPGLTDTERPGKYAPFLADADVTRALDGLEDGTRTPDQFIFIDLDGRAADVDEDDADDEADEAEAAQQWVAVDDHDGTARLFADREAAEQWVEARESCCVDVYRITTD
jgi:hypothetical protein